MRSAVLPLAAALLTLGACGTAREPPPAREQVNVFISPAGEPFRGGAQGAYPIETWFARTDTNGDGALSVEEMEADALAFFRQLDRNGDGFIDGPETAHYEQVVAPELLPRIARLTADDIPPLPGEQTDGTARVAQRRPAPLGPSISGSAFGITGQRQPVAASDLDLDGRVSQAEATAAARRHHARLDLDRDGRITRAELPQTQAQRLTTRATRR